MAEALGCQMRVLNGLRKRQRLLVRLASPLSITLQAQHHAQVIEDQDTVLDLLAAFEQIHRPCEPFRRLVPIAQLRLEHPFAMIDPCAIRRAQCDLFDPAQQAPGLGQSP